MKRAKARGKQQKEALRIRRGTARDVPTIARLIRDLAGYERLSRSLRLDRKRLRRDGFGGRKYFEALICERDKLAVGYALYYFAYSSFSSSPVLFIEDLFVLPDERRRGAGRALMVTLARIAVRRRCEQMEWIVLNWNAPSIAFYRHLGARLDRTWVLTRLVGQSLRRLARQR
jgi:GNAT superfamily N-acetyltransferase